VEFWYYIKTEAGQSIAAIALQEYGTDNINALNQIVTDNENLLSEGITSLLYAGMTLRLRTDYALRNVQISTYFRDMIVNQHNETGIPDDDTGEIPVESLILLQLFYGVEIDRRVVISFAVKNNSALAKTANLTIRLVNVSTEEQINIPVGANATSDIFTKIYDDVTPGVYDFFVTGDASGAIYGIVVPGIAEPGDTIEIPLASSTIEAIFLNYYLIEIDNIAQKNRFAGALRIINENANPVLYDAGYSGVQAMKTEFDTEIIGGQITLKITAPADRTVSFKHNIVSSF